MKYGRLASLSLISAVGLGCSEIAGLTMSELSGVWTATEYLFTSQADGTVTADWLGLGGSLTLTVAPTGDYVAAVTEPGDVLDTRAGTIALAGDTLTISESGQGSPTEYLASQSGNTLTLTSSDEEYDFDDDGTDDPANLRIVLQRQ